MKTKSASFGFHSPPYSYSLQSHSFRSVVISPGHKENSDWLFHNQNTSITIWLAT